MSLVQTCVVVVVTTSYICVLTQQCTQNYSALNNFVTQRLIQIFCPSFQLQPTM